MFLLFASQIFYIIIKSIFVNLYKAQKKQKVYFLKLSLVIVVGFLFNVICFRIISVKESFAVGTLLSAICWYFLSIPDFGWIKYSIKEFLYPFVEMIVFILCGFKLNSILGFIIYILITIIVTYIMLSDEFAYIFSYVSKIIKKNKRKPQ